VSDTRRQVTRADREPGQTDARRDCSPKRKKNHNIPWSSEQPVVAVQFTSFFFRGDTCQKSALELDLYSSGEKLKVSYSIQVPRSTEAAAPARRRAPSSFPSLRRVAKVQGGRRGRGAGRRPVRAEQQCGLFPAVPGQGTGHGHLSRVLCLQ
jgi:hypothetical protein